MSGRILPQKELLKLLQDIKESYFEAKFDFFPTCFVYLDKVVNDSIIDLVEQNCRKGNFWICILSTKQSNIAKLVSNIKGIHYVCISEDPIRTKKDYDKLFFRNN